MFGKKVFDKPHKVNGVGMEAGNMKIVIPFKITFFCFDFVPYFYCDFLRIIPCGDGITNAYVKLLQSLIN